MNDNEMMITDNLSVCFGELDERDLNYLRILSHWSHLIMMVATDLALVDMTGCIDSGLI